MSVDGSLGPDGFGPQPSFDLGLPAGECLDCGRGGEERGEGSAHRDAPHRQGPADRHLSALSIAGRILLTCLAAGGRDSGDSREWRRRHDRVLELQGWHASDPLTDHYRAVLTDRRGQGRR